MYEVKDIPKVPGGQYDDLGFYNLPDGSFYDPDGHFFDKDGFDEFGGFYDENNSYVPGQKNKHLFKSSVAGDDSATNEHGYYDDRFENDELAK